MGARRAMQVTGEGLITLGVLLLLFVVYLLFWTDVRADAASKSVVNDIRHDWSTSAPSASKPSTPANPGHTITKGFALMTIPRLGASWLEPVIEPANTIISADELAEGVVHYKGTAMPGQIGNFAVAGHRKTHGQPFFLMNEMRPGDKIIVETQTDFYTYVVDNDPNSTIVKPTDVWVIEPVPGHPETKPTQALITLTTCNPWWNSSMRMIVFGHLVSTSKKT